MSYSSQGDELFLADYSSKGNKMVRSMRVRDNTGDLRVVYRGSAHDASPAIFSVCHMRDSDTLVVCSCDKGPDNSTPDGWWHWADAKVKTSGAKRREWTSAYPRRWVVRWVTRECWSAGSALHIWSYSACKRGPKLHEFTASAWLKSTCASRRRPTALTTRKWPCRTRRSASVPTCRWPARGDGAHPVGESASATVGCCSTVRQCARLQRRRGTRAEGFATRKPRPTHRQHSELSKNHFGTLNLTWPEKS